MQLAESLDLWLNEQITKPERISEIVFGGLSIVILLAFCIHGLCIIRQYRSSTLVSRLLTMVGIIALLLQCIRSLDLHGYHHYFRFQDLSIITDNVTVLCCVASSMILTRFLATSSKFFLRLGLLNPQLDRKRIAMRRFLIALNIILFLVVTITDVVLMFHNHLYIRSIVMFSFAFVFLFLAVSVWMSISNLIRTTKRYITLLLHPPSAGVYISSLQQKMFGGGFVNTSQPDAIDPAMLHDFEVYLNSIASKNKKGGKPVQPAVYEPTEEDLSLLSEPQSRFFTVDDPLFQYIDPAAYQQHTSDDYTPHSQTYNAGRSIGPSSTSSTHSSLPQHSFIPADQLQRTLNSQHNPPGQLSPARFNQYQLSDLGSKQQLATTVDIGNLNALPDSTTPTPTSHSSGIGVLLRESEPSDNQSMHPHIVSRGSPISSSYVQPSSVVQPRMSLPTATPLAHPRGQYQGPGTPNRPSVVPDSQGNLIYTVPTTTVRAPHQKPNYPPPPRPTLSLAQTQAMLQNNPLYQNNPILLDHEHHDLPKYNIPEPQSSLPGSSSGAQEQLYTLSPQIASPMSAHYRKVATIDTLYPNQVEKELASFLSPAFKEHYVRFRHNIRELLVLRLGATVLFFFSSIMLLIFAIQDVNDSDPVIPLRIWWQDDALSYIQHISYIVILYIAITRAKRGHD